MFSLLKKNVVDDSLVDPADIHADEIESSLENDGITARKKKLDQMLFSPNTK